MGTLSYSLPILLILGILSYGSCQKRPSRPISANRNDFIYGQNTAVYAARASSEQKKVLESLGLGAENFALDFFTVISRSPSENYMISPFSVWSLLVLMSEGAAENTLKEIQDTLKLPDRTNLRSAYKIIEGILGQNTKDVQLSTFNAMVSDRNRPVRSEYRDVIEDIYGADLIDVDFTNPKDAYDRINNYASQKTKGELTRVVTPQDVIKAQMILLSGLNFRGQWKEPFNESNTYTEKFYDINENHIGEVQMMYQKGPFPYSPVLELNAHVLELPYGNGQLSMVFLLPRKGMEVKEVIQKIKTVGFKRLFEILAKVTFASEEDETEVYIPKFSTLTQFNLVEALKIMGIKDLFSSSSANLEGIVLNKSLYVTSLIQKTKIQVDEKGTTASAVTTATLDNKNSPNKFFANRPFAYLIVDKATNTLLFCGQYASPKND